MGIKFNASEVLEMAIEVEKNGAAFYRKAADSKKNMKEVDFLKKLAAMEDDHAKTFATMKKGLTAEEKADTAYDPMGETALYLEAMADSHGGEGNPPAADKLTGRESLADILNIAIGLEKKSILFYLGLRDLVPERLGRGKIDAIINEERSHIAVLAKELKAIK